MHIVVLVFFWWGVLCATLTSLVIFGAQMAKRKARRTPAPQLPPTRLD